MQYRIDETNELEDIFLKSREENQEKFKGLENLSYIYTWRDKERFDKESGKLIVASVSKITNRDRDLYNHDVRIEVDENVWSTLTTEDKKKVAFHELLHVRIEICEESNQIKVDKEGRVCFKLKSHDLSIERFEDELKKYGLSEEEDTIRRYLNKVYKKINKKDK